MELPTWLKGKWTVTVQETNTLTKWYNLICKLRSTIPPNSSNTGEILKNLFMDIAAAHETIQTQIEHYRSVLELSEEHVLHVSDNGWDFAVTDVE